MVTANDIIVKFLELVHLSPEVDKWSIKEFSDNEPRLYRYLQLISLLKAFNLPTDIQSFINGTFVDEHIEKYETLINNILEENRIVYPEFDLEDSLSLSFFFQMLLNYRMEIYKVQKYDEHFFCFSSSTLYVMNKVNILINIINENMKEVDNMLSLVISPEQQKISMDEMVNTFKYPNANLNDIDIENW